MVEEIIGGFASPNIARKGLIRGYGLYVTTDRIIGVKGGWKQWSGIFLGDGVTGAGVDDANRAIKELEQKKDFEVRKEELQEVRIQRRKRTLKRILLWYFYDLWGYVTIRTAKAVYTIQVVYGHTGEVQALKDMFTAFDKSKLIIEDI